MTTAFTPNTLAWFEVATDDPDAATTFYADVFGWSFSPLTDPENPGMDYRLVALPGSDAPFGGITGTGEAMAGHAIFYIAVDDVAATCAAVEQHGGKIVEQQLAPPAGPPFAYLNDSVGSLFGVFAPPA